MTAATILLLLTVCAARMTAIICSTILILHEHMWWGLAVLLIGLLGSEASMSFSEQPKDHDHQRPR